MASWYFHRIISGVEGSISVNFATRTEKFDIKDNFNIYNLYKKLKYEILRDGIRINHLHINIK